jgi:cyanophycinase
MSYCPRRRCDGATASWRVNAVALAALASALVPTGASADSPAGVPAAPASPMVPHGTVIAIGGGLRDDNDAVWSRIVALAGGANSRFVVFATASSAPESAAAAAVAALAAHGARAEPVPVSPLLDGVDVGRAVRDPALLATVRAARGVFFTGGAQERIVDALQPGGEDTPMLEAIRGVLANGGVVAGTSAGAAVMSRIMFRDPPDVLTVMKGSLRDGKDVDRGLCLAGPDLFVDQHFLRRGRIGRLLALMQARGLKVAIGIEEDTAALLSGDEVEAVGPGGVLFVDLRAATTDPMRGAFNVSGARLTYVADGDRIDVRSGTLVPSDEKLAGQRLDPGAPGFRPYFEDTPFLLDVLGDGAVLKAMTYMVDGPAATIRGLAYDARPDAAAPRDLGFEFRFSRRPDTVGWYASVDDTESYSVANVRLDVVPVRVAEPLYTDWPH